MWGFGRVNKQASQPVKKQQENGTTCSLELIGDLIGHSSSVEVPLSVGMQTRQFLLVHHGSFFNAVALNETHTSPAVGFCKILI